MPNPDLPSSPAARAFFAALDTTTTAVSDGASSSSSSLIQKRIQTLGWRNRYSQEDDYPITVNGVNFSVRQVQRGEVEGTYGTGATVWPAAVVLTRYLERHATTLLRDKRVVDLGSGTGITSIAAALLGAKEVICTDGEAAVVRLAAENVKRVVGRERSAEEEEEEHGRHGATDTETTTTIHTIRDCPVRVQRYWWGSGDIPVDGADVVLVADCVLPKLYPIGPLVDALDELLPPPPPPAEPENPRAVAILSYEYRYYPDFDPGEEFRRLCAIKGLSVKTVPLTEQDPVYSVEDIEIWHVQRSTG